VAEVAGYRALVRPDIREVMSVVTTAYQEADNVLVAETAVGLARQFDPRAELVGAAGFGRTNERTLFVVRVKASVRRALLLLVHNSHRGEGAVRFRLVELDLPDGSVLAPDVPHAALSVSHVGAVEKRLKDLHLHDQVATYLAETERAWGRLGHRFWSPRHTKALVRELWGHPKPPVAIDGRALEPSTSWPRHPKDHLTRSLDDVDDAASAYRRVCRYLDHESEARERGDLTKDRDERLALGTGMRLKERVWDWVVENA